MEPEYVTMICAPGLFRPVPVVRARWLDPHGDYPAARVMWAPFMDLSGMAGLPGTSFEYCGIFEGGALVARASGGDTASKRGTPPR